MGPYGPLNQGTNGDVRTNSTEGDAIELKDAAINGDVLVGAGGNPFAVIRTENTTISGVREAATQNLDLPPVTVPPGGVTTGDLTLSNNQIVTLPAGTY